MFENFDLWIFLAGLGIFLFGIYLMEESIKLLSGSALKSMIRRYTATPVKGILTGSLSTAVLQSSSAVSLMVLAFVGAGIMNLINAVAVMMGAKIGTTMTAWIVAVFGFKFSIEAFALPMIAVGGLGLIALAKSPRYVNICKLLVAFGFLFHGLDYMKVSVEDLAASIDLNSLPNPGLWVYLLAGLILTAIMQSSSATIAIVLTMIFTDVIQFNDGAAMVIGANVGTTVTVMLGSIGGIPAKRQAAVSQLIFVSSTAVVAFLVLPVLVWIILDFFSFDENLVLGLALFHTVFNVLSVVMFYPFIPRLIKTVQDLIPEKHEEFTVYIGNTSPEVPDAAVVAIRKEIINQLSYSINYIKELYNIFDNKKETKLKYKRLTYPDLEKLHAEIFEYYARLLRHEISVEDAAKLEKYVRSSRSIMNAAKNLFELYPRTNELAREDNTFLQDSYREILGRIKDLEEVANLVIEDGISTDMSGFLNSSYFSIEEADKDFIKNCAHAIAEEKVEEQEITRLLMINRAITQSLRMFILSMQGLMYDEEKDDELPTNPTEENQSAEVIYP
jgi:phosphate:Na+ symporter